MICQTHPPRCGEVCVAVCVVFCAAVCAIACAACAIACADVVGGDDELHAEWACSAAAISLGVRKFLAAG